MGQMENDMENKMEILGYYKRERDGSEYIHYQAKGKEHLTNGICIWEDKEGKGILPPERLAQLEKTEGIDLRRMLGYLKRYSPYADITKYVEEKAAGSEGRSVMAKLSSFKEKANATGKESPKGQNKEAADRMNHSER